METDSRSLPLLSDFMAGNADMKGNSITSTLNPAKQIAFKSLKIASETSENNSDKDNQSKSSRMHGSNFGDHGWDSYGRFG